MTALLGVLWRRLASVVRRRRRNRAGGGGGGSGMGSRGRGGVGRKVEEEES